MSDKVVFETFRDIGSFERGQMKQDEPSCFNSMVRVEKYRVTIEKVDEPVELIRARLRKLWAENSNHHNWDCLLRMGKKFGIDLRERPNVEVTGLSPGE